MLTNCNRKQSVSLYPRQPPLLPSLPSARQRVLVGQTLQHASDNVDSSFFHKKVGEKFGGKKNS